MEMPATAKINADSPRRGSLLGKLLISTSIGITAVFAVTGWIVQDRASRLTALSLEEEVQSGLRAYEALWRARSEMLSSISLILSRMPDVRAAFSTGDEATIRDSAQEIWQPLSREDAVFLVCAPDGKVIASLGRVPPDLASTLPFVQSASAGFPGQRMGFEVLGGTLFQTVVTPVYVSTSREPALINVLVAGYALDNGVANRLRASAGETNFTFSVGGRQVAASNGGDIDVPPEFVRELRRPLRGLDEAAIGELRITRSFEAARQHVERLRRDIFMIWAVALCTGLLLIHFLARRFLRPLADLDSAAREIARGNFGVTLAPGAPDEIGRLSESFNSMSVSLREARAELIRNERIATIGRLSTSLVHDLRNPLAAIYGGAELLVDSNLTGEQVKRLASNIYKSSRRIQELLQDLIQVSRGKADHREPCRLIEVAGAAAEQCRPAADASAVRIAVDIDGGLELTLARSRVERVFQNLISNAVEAMPGGGTVTISARREGESVVVDVEDSGPGVPTEIHDRLFQPFVTSGKRSGLGLGLALSRHTLLDHGGDLWLDQRPGGARFRLRFPAV
jgi:signal transduction histidine kinase